MTDKLLIKRELLERIDETAICDGTDATISDDLFTQLVAALAAPRQTEGDNSGNPNLQDGLEVVAWQDADNPLYTTGERRQMHGWATDGYPIVELCRLSDHLRAIAVLREECERLRKMIEVANSFQDALENQRDTLRQQLDVMTKDRDDCLEARLHYAGKYGEALAQRDKLAGLLRMVRQDGWYHPLEEHEIAQIDAALAEVGK